VLKYDPKQAVLAQTTGMIASALAILAVGWAASRVAPRYLLRTGVVLLMLGAVPFYAALESRSASLPAIRLIAGICAGFTNGSFAVLLTDLFPTSIRFTGVALVFNVSFTIFSGLSPLVATTLIRNTGSVTAPAYLMMASALIALVGSLGARRFGGAVLGKSSIFHLHS
jgi:MFS family permease